MPRTNVKGSPKSAPDIGNLKECTEDIRRAALDGDTGPDNPTSYGKLRGRLEASRGKLPPLYQKGVYRPFVDTLDDIGQAGFTKILLKRDGTDGMMLDIAHAILQNGEGYCEKATDAFQEVISDLYDGFLSAEDRRGVKKPDKSTIAPLVKWGNPDFGPYTWPVDATESFGLKTAIVNMPPANARKGLLAWAALAHETAGHDILAADIGLKDELARGVATALHGEKLGSGLPEYWAERIDETASDVMGMLNMGPAAGIGLIGFFRGLNEAYYNKSGLLNEGPGDDPHPADILRGYLAAAVVELLSFDGAAAWAKTIEAETDRDLAKIRLGRKAVSAADARKSARTVAATLVRGKLASLENHALGEIQNWRDHDETVARKLRELLTSAGQLPARYATGIYAAHVVSAAVYAALAKGADIPLIFDRMLAILKGMHNGNPSWGPLYVLHPGNVCARMAYLRRGGEAPDDDTEP